MAIARSQMYRQLYGIGNLVKREEYGLGSKIKGALKSVAKAVIPKELDPVLKIAAPFLGPVYGPIASIAGSARSGKLDPLSIALTMAPYLQFNTSATGLGSFLPTGYGGSQYGIFGGDYVGIGTQSKSLSSILTDKAKEFLSPTTSPTPITPNFTTPTQVDLTGGADALTYKPVDVRGIDSLDQLGYPRGTEQQLGRTSSELQSLTVSGGGVTPSDTARSASELIKTYGVQPGTEPGYLDLIKKAGTLENIPLSERFAAVQELGGKALKDIYTKPIPGEPGKTQLDKTSIIATLAGAATFAEAKKIADDAGLSDDEFNEEVYQRIKISPEKEKYTSSLRPEAFGIRNLSAEGGMMNDMQSGVLSIMLTPANREKFQVGGMKRDMSNNRISQIIQLIRDAESVGDKEKAEELRLDLFRETKKADGGRIGYFMGSEIPVRKNQGGVTELDLRNKGGFIPVGIKEKADDVPAMLSKNEFVFTADAVRGAGKGSINKGAQKMYKLMKSLEKKVKKQRR